jgi:hypothetical protein
MKALVLNALGHGFDLEDVEIAAPIGREVILDVRALRPITGAEFVIDGRTIPTI